MTKNVSDGSAERIDNRPRPGLAGSDPGRRDRLGGPSEWLDGLDDDDALGLVGLGPRVGQPG